MLLGCGRGYVSKHILPESVRELILCDVSKANLDVAPVNEGIEVKRMILDEENIKVKFCMETNKCVLTNRMCKREIDLCDILQDRKRGT